MVCWWCEKKKKHVEERKARPNRRRRRQRWRQQWRQQWRTPHLVNCCYVIFLERKKWIRARAARCTPRMYASDAAASLKRIPHRRRPMVQPKHRADTRITVQLCAPKNAGIPPKKMRIQRTAKAVRGLYTSDSAALRALGLLLRLSTYTYYIIVDCSCPSPHSAS